MPIIHVIGAAHPLKANVTMANTYKVVVGTDIGTEVKVALTIHEGVIDAECEIEKFDAAGLSEAISVVHDLASTLLDVLGYVNGAAFSVSIEELVPPDGKRGSLGSMNRDLAALNTAIDGDAGYEEAVGMFFADSQLRTALADLTTSLRVPGAAKVNCARVVDTIKHLITPEDMKDKQKWPLMHAVLNTTEPYVQFITETSKLPRHGQAHNIPGTVAGEVHRRAWTIMNRYLEYRKRGPAPLPLDEFPLLTSP